MEPGVRIGALKESGLQVGLVSPDHLHLVGPGFLHLLQKYGKEWLEIVTPDSIVQQLVEGNLDLWLGTDGQVPKMALIGAWEYNALKNFYHIAWMGGYDLAQFRAAGSFDLIERYVAARGGDEVVIAGRKGWEKVAGELGYSTTTVQLRKNVKKAWAH